MDNNNKELWRRLYKFTLSECISVSSIQKFYKNALKDKLCKKCNDLLVLIPKLFRVFKIDQWKTKILPFMVNKSYNSGEFDFYYGPLPCSTVEIIVFEMLLNYPEYLPDCVYLLLTSGEENSKILNQVIGENYMKRSDFYKQVYEISKNNKKNFLLNHISHEKIKESLPFKFIHNNRELSKKEIDFEELNKILENMSNQSKGIIFYN